MSEIQEAEDKQVPVAERGGIGGELIFVTMSSHDGEAGREIVTRFMKCHRFADFEEAYASGP